MVKKSSKLIACLRVLVYTTLVFIFAVLYLYFITFSEKYGWSNYTFWLLINIISGLTYAYSGIIIGVSFAALADNKYFWVAMPVILVIVNAVIHIGVDRYKLFFWLKTLLGTSDYIIIT